MLLRTGDYTGLKEDRARHVFRDILLGVAYCHARQLVHRDLKLENLLLTADKNTCKVADFGFAKDTSLGAPTTILGTYKYVAPEMLSGEAYDAKSDMWQVGVCLFCTVECRFPFDNPGRGAGGHGKHKPTPLDKQTMDRLMTATCECTY